MAGVGFLQSLWQKQIRKGIWPYLDPMDGVCLRTASMEWTLPGKYGQGELFFFLIQKERASMLGSETVSPFLNADIRTPLLSASPQEVLAYCFALDRGRRKRRRRWMSRPWFGG